MHRPLSDRGDPYHISRGEASTRIARSKEGLRLIVSRGLEVKGSQLGVEGFRTAWDEK